MTLANPIIFRISNAVQLESRRERHSIWAALGMRATMSKIDAGYTWD